MSYDSLLINTCDLIESVLDKWNVPTITVTAGVKCRIMYGYRLVRNVHGEEVVSFAKLFFLKTQALNNAMKVKIASVEHPIIKLSVHQDDTASHHKEVYIS